MEAQQRLSEVTQLAEQATESEDSEEDVEEKSRWERMNHKGKVYFWNWDSSG